MKKFAVIVVPVLVLILLLGMSVGLAKAQTGGPTDERPAVDPGTTWSNYIPIQGKLTDASGTPLTGNYDITVNLYDVLDGGTALCSDTRSGVNVDKGLFSTYAYFQGCDAIDGRQLYLGLQVGADPEMTPRRYIDNVPYAWSFRPGALVAGTSYSKPILELWNFDPNGRGLRSYAQSTTGTNYAVVGASKSPDGFGGYFYNTGGGTGLKGESNTGAAIVAAGSGVIRSSAQSSVWISGNDVRVYQVTDTTIINLDSVGGAKISRGATAGYKNVMLPITVPGPLYGQNVKVVDLDIYFLGDTDFDAITTIRLRRQTGVCETASCYVEILQDTVDHTCDVSTHATGCTLHYDLTTNNTLTSTSGILYLTLEMGFSSSSSWIELGGARLVLEHD